MSWLARRTALIAAGQAVVKSGHMVAALLLIRVLEPEAWSRLALLLSIYVAGASLGTLNLQHALLYFAARVPASGRRALAGRTSVLLAASGAITALLVLAAGAFVDRGAHPLGGALCLVALALALEVPAAGAAQLLLAAERPASAALWDIGQTALLLAALLGPSLAGHAVEATAGALVVQAAVRLAGWLVLVARLHPGTWRGQRALWSEQIRYSLPLGAALAAGALARQIDKWLVAALSPGELGAYAAAAQEIPIVPVLPFAMGAALATRTVAAFLAGRRDRAAAFWMAQTTRMVLVVVPVAVGLVVAGGDLAPLLFTEEYAAAAVPFQLYAAILLHRVAEYGLVLRAAGDTRGLVGSAAVLLTATVALGAPATWWLGAVGASAAALAAHGCAWLYALRRIARALDRPLRRSFPWRQYGEVLALSVGCGVTAWALARGFEPSATRLAVQLAIYGPAIALVLRMTGAAARVSAIPGDDDDRPAR